MNITLIKTDGQGWEFPCENNWPCTVAFALGDPPNPVTEEEADRQAKLIAAAPDLLSALQNLVADWERVQGRPIPEDHEARAAITKATK